MILALYSCLLCYLLCPHLYHLYLSACMDLLAFIFVEEAEETDATADAGDTVASLLMSS